MKLTVWEFLNEYQSLVDQSWLNSLEQKQVEVLEMVNQILSHNINVQCLLEDLPEDELELEKEIKQLQVEQDTISQMCIMLNEWILYEDAVTNFELLLEFEDEKDIFLNIIDIYENFWLEEAIKQVKKRDLINIISKESYLYAIIEGLYKWEDLEKIMVNELNSIGIDLKKNPIVKRPEEVKEFLSEVEAFLYRLLLSSDPLITNDTLNVVN